MTGRRFITFVMKISKYCNLRCRYCYELPELGDKTRMQLPLIGQMLENVRRHADASQLSDVSFIWHGGEPFLIPLDTYDAIGRMQKEVLGPDIVCRNPVQSNLTILTDRHIAYLQSETFFSGLGISFDGYGDQRVDTAGRLRTDTVLGNIQKLIEHGIPFGAITVLAQNTLPHVPAIYAFYDDLGIDSRFLAFYMDAGVAQAREHALSYAELIGAYQTLFDLWAASDSATPVDPIARWTDVAVNVLCGHAQRRHFPFDDERVFFVGIDGTVWGEADCYGADHAYGNLGHQPLAELLSSPARLRAVEQAKARMEAFCSPCPYFGYCSGDEVANATAAQRSLLAQHGCAKREMISYILNRLEAGDIANELRTGAAIRLPDNGALSISF